MIEPPVIQLIDADIPASARGDTPLLKGINWSIQPRDFWVVGGMHVSGKSGVLATAAGLAPPVRGKCFLFGRDLAEMVETEVIALRQKIGFLFSGIRPFSDLTVAENVSLPWRYHQNQGLPESDGRTRHMLDLMELGTYAHLSESQVGHPWRQRIGLARALMLRPEILILDNPLTGLDPRHVTWWVEFLRQLAAGHEVAGGRPMTIIASTENFSAWLGIGKQFALLHQNQWCFIGGPQDLLNCRDPIASELLVRTNTA